MNHETTYLIAKLMLIIMVTQLFVLGYTFYTDYSGRKAISNAARVGCERDRRSRIANATGWRIAEDARQQSGDISVANRYSQLAETLEEASRADCNKEFPKASIIP